LSYEDIITKEDDFFKNLNEKTIKEIAQFLPEDFSLEKLNEIGKLSEDIYKRVFKNSARNSVKNNFISNDKEKNKRLQLLLEEIDKDKISFKNLKSKYKYYLEGDENYINKREHLLEYEKNDTNKLFSLESKITIEDL